MKKISPLQEGIEGILKEFKLVPEFPKKMKEELRHLPHEISREEILLRTDLTEETIFTIDGEDARDFDDAVGIRETASGGFILTVSIADVSHYVTPGSAIDREAYRRATSTYFPRYVVPMLPEILSNELCSLVPHENRLTFTAEMEFDARGRRIRSDFYKSVIHSAARLTYTKVRKILADRDPVLRREYAALIPHLEAMQRLALLLQKMRAERGSLDFDLAEPFIEMNLEEGTIEKIIKAERNLAHRLIEEFMIAANEAVAEFVTERGLPMIYRIHEEPDPEKLKDLFVLLHNLGFSIPSPKKIRPPDLVRVIEAVRGRPEERLINTVLLRTMAKAIYDAKNIGHFGLASGCYTHFTSPIRRYPDLIVHRILSEALERSPEKGRGKGKTRSPQVAALRTMAQHCSDQERISMKAEWASRDLAAALFMKKHVGKTFSGIISSVVKFGFFVELLPYFVEGLVPLRRLTDDFYVFHEKAHAVVGRRKNKKYQVGTSVNVKVAGVNFDKRWVDFEIV